MQEVEIELPQYAAQLHQTLQDWVIELFMMLLCSSAAACIACVRSPRSSGPVHELSMLLSPKPRCECVQLSEKQFASCTAYLSRGGSMEELAAAVRLAPEVLEQSLMQFAWQRELL